MRIYNTNQQRRKTYSQTDVQSVCAILPLMVSIRTGCRIYLCSVFFVLADTTPSGRAPHKLLNRNQKQHGVEARNVKFNPLEYGILPNSLLSVCAFLFVDENIQGTRLSVLSTSPDKTCSLSAVTSGSSGLQTKFQE
jgi:hypothetical protein